MRARWAAPSRREYRLVAPLRERADRGLLEHPGGAGGVDGNILHRAAFGDGEIQFHPTLDLVLIRPCAG